jgi:hypothetical protein
MACVYRHIDDRGVTFYVGISKNNKRPKDYHSRSNMWKYHANKYGVSTEILKSNISFDEAKEIEIALISFLGRKDLKNGRLVNMTNGGDGVVGHSPEAIEKIRKAHIGRKHSKREIQKRVNANKGKKRSKKFKDSVSDRMKGVVFSDEHRKRISESLKGNIPANAKKVANILTGDIYDSLKSACLELNLNYKTEHMRMSRNPLSIKNKLRFI